MENKSINRSIYREHYRDRPTYQIYDRCSPLWHLAFVGLILTGFFVCRLVPPFLLSRRRSRPTGIWTRLVGCSSNKACWSFSKGGVLRCAFSRTGPREGTTTETQRHRDTGTFKTPKTFFPVVHRTSYITVFHVFKNTVGT